ncbi:MAG TPA: hypothetical protein VF008_01910 [Niastella sp.]
MNKIIFRLMLLTSVVIVIFMACKKDDQQNEAPVAYAGINKFICLPIDSVELTGQGTDTDGSIASYEWTKTIGPAQYTLEDSTAAVAKAKGLVEGLYVFELKVTDDRGLSAIDGVIVTVRSDSACAGYWDY